MKSDGEILSLVYTDKNEYHLICYNQYDDTIITIQNYGRLIVL